MPQSPDLSKYLDAGVEFVAMTRAQARARAKELVAQGHLAQNQVQGFVDDLVEESRRRTDLVLDVVRQEIQRQVKTLGIATKADLTRLESKLASSTRPAARTAPTKRAAAPKTSHRRPPRRRPRARSPRARSPPPRRRPPSGRPRLAPREAS